MTAVFRAAWQAELWSDCGVARGKPSPDDRSQLEARLAELGAERLAAELVALAEADRDIERRVKLLVSEGDRDALGTELRRRIAGLARSSRFVAYRESFALARQLAEVVEAIERKLLPLDPAQAFELADAFLETDHNTFGRIDDSSGVVADRGIEPGGSRDRESAATGLGVRARRRSRRQRDH